MYFHSFILQWSWMTVYTLYTLFTQCFFKKEGYIYFHHLTKKKRLTVTSRYEESDHFCLINIVLLRRKRKGSILTDGLQRLLTCGQTLMTFELCATPRKPSDVTSWRFEALKSRRQNSRGDFLTRWRTDTPTQTQATSLGLSYCTAHRNTNPPPWQLPLIRERETGREYLKNETPPPPPPPPHPPLFKLSFIFVHIQTDWAYISWPCLHYVVYFSHGPL